MQISFLWIAYNMQTSYLGFLYFFLEKDVESFNMQISVLGSFNMQISF